jgi:tRNA A-37 threonylcarbamoyl transferase component Bud32
MPAEIRKLGRYEIIREIGRGGMAVVYLARQKDLDRVVALKELAAFHAADPDLAERFVRESRISASLSHANVVTVHDFFEFEGTPYIAMEYFERGSLRPFVGRLTLAQIAGVLEGVLAGLTHAETRGVVHRDLKPENVMVAADGSVKIADFGIAKALNQVAESRALSATGTTLGTPAYMAPEQARSTGVGPWTDVYSTGVMAYELILDRLPFTPGDTPVAVLLRVVNDPVPPPREIDPRLDPTLAAWLERMLAKDPADRPAGARAAWQEFEETIIGLIGPRWRRDAPLVELAKPASETHAVTPVRKVAPTELATPAVGSEPLWGRTTRRRLPLAVAAVLVVALVAGLALATVIGDGETSTRTEADQGSTSIPEASGTAADTASNVITESVAGFSVEIPKSWRTISAEDVTEEGGTLDQALDEVPALEPYVAQLKRADSPLKLFAHDEDGFTTNMMIGVQDLPPGMDRQDYEQWTLDYTKRLPFVVGDVKTDRVALPAARALRLRYRSRVETADIAVMTAGTQYVLVVGGRAYVLTFSTQPSLEPQDGKTFRSIAQSFRVG